MATLGAAAFALLIAACGGEPEPAPRGHPSTAAEAPVAGAAFVDRAAETGLEFSHFNGRSGEYYYCEIMSAGVGLLDYDRDGDLDVYLNQGRMLGPDKSLEQATVAPPPGPLTDRLFRNDLEVAADGSRRLRFTDVTEESGLVADGYGMGVAVGDYNGDGWPDLYVTTWGSSNQLWRNNGDRTFTEVTAEAGVGETRWSIAAAFFDYDRDGDQDLFVVNYLDYSYSAHKECNNDLGLRDYCGPVSYKPLPDVLYRNRGDGTFEEVSRVLGGDKELGSGMGVAVGDFDGNGWLDLYVANDELPNHLWMNSGDGTFRNEALMAGAAVNAQGKAEAGMGVGIGDHDGDGDEDLFVAHLDQETNTLYSNTGNGSFEDRTNESRLGAPSWASTSFGAGFLDYDNDGRLDLFVANGAVQAVRELLLAGDPFPFHQRNQLFRNLGDTSYGEVTSEAGPPFQLSEVSRGAAFGDIDNDGDTDIVVLNNSGPARLLLNQIGQDREWLGVEALVGDGRGVHALGALVELVLADGSSMFRRARTDSSYASAHDPRVLFGLGDLPAAERIRVTWPDGLIEEWPAAETRTYRSLRRGTGQAAGSGAR